MKRRNLKFRNNKIARSRNSQQGYLLISLMLIVALAAIALIAILPSIRQQFQRDQEDELRHRGTEYMRATQHFYKKFGRYPTRIEELENSNNIRFLRKRFKDPITGKDFKLLHMQDITLNNGPMLGAMAGALAGQGGLQGQNGLLAQSGAGGLQAGALQGALGQAGQLGGLSAQGLQGAIGQMAQSGAVQSAISNLSQNGGDSATAEAVAGLLSSSGNGVGASDSSSSSSSSSGSGTGAAGSGASSGFNGPVFGGGPILGVASISKAKSIREFDHKNHYNDWLFIYDPTLDRGGLLVGPYQTGITPGGGLMPGAPGSGTPGSGTFGSGTSGSGSFGSSPFSSGPGQGMGQGFGTGGGFNQPGQPAPQSPPQNSPNNN